MEPRTTDIKEIKKIGNSPAIAVSDMMTRIGAEVGDVVKVTLERTVAPATVSYWATEDGSEVATIDHDSVDSARYEAYYLVCHNNWHGVKVIDNQTGVTEFWHTIDGSEALVKREDRMYTFFHGRLVPVDQDDDGDE